MSPSLSALRARYRTLSVPSGPLEGRYRGELVGPAWFRRLASSAIDLGRLRGWWGKEFDGKGSAMNLVTRDGRLERVLPMRVTRTASRIDEAETITLSTLSGSQFPLVRMIDELRQLDDDGTLLGLNMILLRRGGQVALPFVLHPELE